MKRSNHATSRDAKSRSDDHAREALEERDADFALDELVALTASADPVLADLWNNPKDARYQS